jgi:hypothetical protein
MTQYATWASYGGDARTWLALGLLAAAGAAVLAGLRLPLPAQFSQPGAAGRAALMAALATSILAFLVCASIYFRQVNRDIRAAGLSAPALRLTILPVTLTAAAVLFVVIISRRSPDLRTRLASAAIGAIAAPMIFELPFDPLVIFRIHLVVAAPPPWILVYAPLLLVEIATLLLLWLSPMVALIRATFFSFALMLGVWAAWALAGFGYPSAPLPIALNIASKILAFVAAFTLFLPRQLTGERAFGGTAVELGGAPAVPRDDRAIGPIRVAERLELLRSRRRYPPRQTEPFPHPEITHGPHIQAPQLKHQKHLRRPPADAPDLRKHGDDLVVAMAPQPGRIEHHRPVPDLGRQIPNRRRLVGG